MKRVKILLYDIETSPNLGYVWGKYEQNVLAYEKEWEILSFAYKWAGEDKAPRCETRESQKDDLKLVKRLHALFSEADILVAHNGDSFDKKKVKARMLFHGLSPVKILTTIDTKKVAKDYFNFNGNGLDDLGKFLKLGQKVKHSGFDMWLGCLRGEAKSWREMSYYNKQDVVLLEKVYERFKPWIENHPNVARLLHPADKSLGICPTCSSKNVEKRGVRAAAVLLKQQWHCERCGRWFLTRRVA